MEETGSKKKREGEKRGGGNIEILQRERKAGDRPPSPSIPGASGVPCFTIAHIFHGIGLFFLRKRDAMDVWMDVMGWDGPGLREWSD